MKPCPACEGPHFYGLTWAHRTYCPHYDQDTATVAADFQRGSGIRDLTTSERNLTHDNFSHDLADGEHLAVRFSHVAGIDNRTVVVLDGAGRYLRDALAAGDPGDDGDA